MSSATPHPPFAKLMVALAAFAMLATACAASTTEITNSAGTDSTTDTTASSSDPETAVEPTVEPVEAPTEPPAPEPTAVPEPAPTEVEETPTEVPVAQARIIPSGWQDFDLTSFQSALPGDWDGLTTSADIDQMLDAATQNSDPVLAAQLEQYRQLVNGGNALIGLGFQGDNFNAFRQPGTAVALGSTIAVEAQLEQQLATFAEDVVVEASFDAVNGREGLRTQGAYTLQGERVHLYQFAAEVDNFLYYFTVTLFSGDDPALAEQIFEAVGFE